MIKMQVFLPVCEHKCALIVMLTKKMQMRKWENGKNEPPDQPDLVVKPNCNRFPKIAQSRIFTAPVSPFY